MATQISNPETISSPKIPSTMRAVVYRGINDMRVETVPVPEIGAGRAADQGGDLRHLRDGSEEDSHGLAFGAAHLWPRDGRDRGAGGRGRDATTPLATG